MKPSDEKPAAEGDVPQIGGPPSGADLKALIVDATVALESMLYPEFADESVDPHQVNDRLLAWLDGNLDWSQ
jgi:hypothetical protein